MRELGLVNVRAVGLLGGAMSINYGEKRSDGVLGSKSVGKRLVLSIPTTPPLHPSIPSAPPSPALPRRKHFGQNAQVNFREKIIAWETLPEWRAAVRASGKRLVDRKST